MPFLIDVCSILHPNLALKIDQNHSKIDAKMHSILDSMFNRFLADFYSQLRPPESQKSSPPCSETTIFQKIALRNWHRLLIECGANLTPFCLPKSSKILPNIDPRMHQFFDRFLHRFFVHFSSNLGTKLGPCWPLFRSKWSDHVGGRPLFCCVAFFNGFFSNCWSQGPMGYPIFAPQVRWGTHMFVRLLDPI